MQPQSGLASTLIPLVIIGVVFALRFRAMTRERPLNIGQLWLVPALYAVVVVLNFMLRPPQGVQWVFVGVAVTLGAVLGWVRGRTTRITVDPANGAVSAAGSPAAVLLLVVLIAVRSVGRQWAAESGIDPLLIADILLSFALGLLTLQRVEMAMRARRLLAAHHAGPAFVDEGGTATVE